MQKDSKDSRSVDYGNFNSDKDTNAYCRSDNNTSSSSSSNQPPNDYSSQNYPNQSFHDGGGHYDYDDDCDLEILQRVRFFNGQLLYSEDLNQFSKYFNNKQRLLNQQVVGVNGIVCGLRVENVIYDNGCLNINISKGFAIDCCGKEIIIAKDSKYTIEFPIQICKEKISRIGLFIARNEIKKLPKAATSLECGYDNNFENTRKETRIEEGYKLFLKPIEKNFLITEFNKKSYCISDIVIIEVWDPDNILKDKAIKIKSNYTEEEIEIQLKKLDKDSNFYRGELALSLDQSIKDRQLRVNKIDTITAKLGEFSLEKAYVNSTNSFMYNEKKRINNYLECNHRECNNIFYSHQSDQSTDKYNHGILVAIIKNEINGNRKEDSNLAKMPSSSTGYGGLNIFVDKEESLLCRKVIYKNQMLYDLFTNKTDCKSKITVEELDKTILLVSKEVTYETDSITQGHYKIMKTINIFESSDLYNNNNNKELEFPPFVYLGMVLPGNKNNETILFNEDIYKESHEKIVIDGQTYAPEPTDNYTKNALKDTISILENNIVFKPIDIRRKEKSFRILIAKHNTHELNKNKKEHTSSKTNQNESDKAEGSLVAEEDGKKEEITLRWWAICKFKNSL